MAKLTLSEMAQATNGQVLAGDPQLSISSISIDSRTLKRGDLFFAIKGPRFDGHDFVADALARGAQGAVVSSSWAANMPKDICQGFGDRALIAVADTARALQDLGGYVRRRWGGKVIGVTGSTGKTSTKDYAAAILSAKFRVHKSPGNLNNLYGLPLSLFALDPSHQVAVLEMGMSRRGEIARLAEIARPDVGIYTNIAPVHLEFFSSVEEIAEAKAELVAALEGNGCVIYNRDDELVCRMVGRFSGEKISYGINELSDVQATKLLDMGIEGLRFEVSFAGLRRELFVPLLGAHNLYNVLAAMAAALRFGMTLDQIEPQLAGLRASSMRGHILRFADGFVVIDDSYNSNPRAFKEMIKTLAAISGFERRIVVAGQMLELGPESARLHWECGELLSRFDIDLLICVGGDARHMAEGALRGGMQREEVIFFQDARQAGEHLCAAVRAGDLVLVKGSRGVRLEQAIEALKGRFRILEGQ